MRQSERGILLPKPAIPGVVATFKRFQTSVPKILNPPQARFGDSLSTEQITAFQADVEKRINLKIVPAYDRILEIFNEGYRNRAPDQWVLVNIRVGGTIIAGKLPLIPVSH